MLDVMSAELDAWRTKPTSCVDAHTQSEGVRTSTPAEQVLGSVASSGALVHAPTLTPAQPSTVESTSLLTERELSKLISDMYREHPSLAVVDGGGLSLATSIQQHYLRQCGLQRLADEQVRRLIASVHACKATNRKVLTFGRFCGLVHPLPPEALHLYLRLLSATHEHHGCDFGSEWVGSTTAAFCVSVEAAVRAVHAALHGRLTPEWLTDMIRRTLELATTTAGKRVVELDALLELVLCEYEAEETSLLRTLEETCAAADVEGDGLLAYDEFAEMARTVEPGLSSHRASALLASALRESGGSGTITPAGFATAAMRSGLVTNRVSGQSRGLTTSHHELTTSESATLLRTLWQAVAPSHLSTADAALRQVSDDLEALLGGAETHGSIERAWMLYHHIVPEAARLT